MDKSAWLIFEQPSTGSCLLAAGSQSIITVVVFTGDTYDTPLMDYIFTFTHPNKKRGNL
jgi:hypothetical protein